MKKLYGTQWTWLACAAVVTGIAFEHHWRAISNSDHPLLVVDLFGQRGRTFRTLPVELASIDNNLSVANMGFEAFADLVDETGVFRGRGYDAVAARRASAERLTE